MRQRHRLALTLCVLFLSGHAAAADPTRIALALADNFAIPRFQAVGDATAKQDQAWTQYCSDREHGDPQSLRAVFDSVGDTWANIEFFRIGPAATELRADRFSYWLDKQNATGRGLNALLASSDAGSLAPGKIASGSAAGQGLPLLERLLYDDGALDKLRAKGADGERRCAVGRAVAHNLSVIALAIVSDWTAPGGARAAIAANKPWHTSFADAKQAADVMMTDVAGMVEVLKDRKVPLLFHDAANAEAPRLAEAARSGRSLRDLTLNLAALRKASDMFLAQASEQQKKTLDDAFDLAAGKLGAIGAGGMNVRQKLAAIQSAIDAFTTLRDTVDTVLPAATGLSLGFNNLDGD